MRSRTESRRATENSSEETPEDPRPERPGAMSLAQLARSLVQVIDNAPGKQIDLTEAAEQLGVQKRRVYDITNVLEGNLELSSKNEKASGTSKRPQGTK